MKKEKAADKAEIYKNKKALVVGLGTSGIAACQALLALGADVSVQDAKKESEIDANVLAWLKDQHITCCFGRAPEEIEAFDLIVPSPGVPLQLPFLQQAAAAGVPLMGELEIAWRLGRGHFAAITGTNGKTTTTSLVGEMFRAGGFDTRVVGNIGVAVISEAMKADEDTWLITETSSFQLETIHDFRPEVSAILNITPDHLDRHGSLENYSRAKARIFENQERGDYVVMNFDDRESFRLASSARATLVPFSRKEKLPFGAFVKNDRIVIRNHEEETIDFCGVDELQIPGSHNLENALAATAIAYFAGVDPQAVSKALRSFTGVPHRIEYCGTVDGVRYVNDSKGTNPDAAIKAIEAIKGDLILIAGGYDKDADFGMLIDAFGTKVRHVVLLGATASKIKIAAENKGYTHTTIMKDMEDCVREAARLARPGDTVLLSPACASWDMYENFEQRGDHFRQCVEELER
ncbi:MAG: UDP-N-acetylmuramoyl-L-alanine--D-glutamate ligase [Anaerovoracaceae bacterium]|jgi:UDP-N-acetylmuramoylalanine--D-glutamate ligase